MVSDVMPQKATSPQPSAPPEPEKIRDSDHATMLADAVAKQGPPPAGMGKLVDKTV
jgi:hypothetical protein